MSGEDHTVPPRRRIDDERIDRIEGRMESFEKLLAENTTTTTEVRDILITVRTLGKFAVWAGTIFAAVVGAYVAITQLGIHP